MMSYKNRKELNLKIARTLTDYLIANPDIRFGQALETLGIVDSETNDYGVPIWYNHFYEEPKDMLERMEKFNK